MKEVNIYIQSSIRTLKPHDGAVGYILEMKTQNGPATLSNILKIQNATANQSELRALIEALKRLREKCSLTIYTESYYVAAGYEKGWVEHWLTNGWKTARKKETANREEWEELNNLLQNHEFAFRVEKQNEYRGWLRDEVEKKAKEM